jgi:DNA polymerase IV
MRTTATLAEIAEELVRTALSDHPDEKTLSPLAISVSHLEKHWKRQSRLNGAKLLEGEA